MTKVVFRARSFQESEERERENERERMRERDRERERGELSSTRKWAIHPAAKQGLVKNWMRTWSAIKLKT
jgi:hypothetical protein